MTLPFSAQLSQLPEFLSLALLHFLWQGALLAAVLGLALQWIPRRAASVRHNLACLTLLLMLLAPPSTLVWLLSSDPARQPTVLANSNAIANRKPAGTLAVPATLTFPTWGDSNWLPWVSVLWLGGVLGFSMRWVGGFREVHALKTRDTHAVTSEWLDRFEKLRIRMGVGAKVRLLESTRITGPLVIGWLRPVVLMPLGLLSGLPTAQVESLILHELAHIRGNDYLINLIVRFAETVLFYHPVVWWVGKQIEQEREKRCDDAVRDAMGEGQSLAEALLNLCEREAGIASLALAATGSSIGDRVRRLAGQEETGTTPPVRRRWGWAMVLIVLLVGAALIVPRVRPSFLYLAHARIRINEPATPTTVQSPFDPYRLQTNMERMRAEILFRRVVNEGKLTTVWHLPEEACIQKLRQHSNIRQFGSTPLLEVRIADEDPTLAAKMANLYAEAITERFNDQQKEELTKQRDRRRKKSIMLRDHLEVVSGEIAELKKQAVDSIQLELLTDRFQLLRELNREEERRSFEDDGRPDIAQSPTVEIVDPAFPQLRRTFWHSQE